MGEWETNLSLDTNTIVDSFGDDLITPHFPRRAAEQIANGLRIGLAEQIGARSEPFQVFVGVVEGEDPTKPALVVHITPDMTIRYKQNTIGLNALFLRTVRSKVGPGIDVESYFSQTGHGDISVEEVRLRAINELGATNSRLFYMYRQLASTPLEAILEPVAA